MTQSDLPGVPVGWEFPLLPQIAEINPPIDRDGIDDKTEVTFVPMRVVEPEGGGLVNPELRAYSEVKTGFKVFRSGDIIMAKITPCMENGKTTVVPPLLGPVCFGSTEFHVIRPEDGIAPRWVAHFLLQHEVRRAAQRAMTGGVGQMRVPQSFLEALHIPIAPGPEQCRIADSLDELLSGLGAGVSALERVRGKLSQYRASVLKAAVEGALTVDWREQHPVTEPASELLKRILVERRLRWEKEQLHRFTKKKQDPPKNWKTKYKEPVAPNTIDLPRLPDAWCWATVDQCAVLIEYGTSAKAGPDAHGIPVLRMGNLTTDGRLALDDLKYLPTVNPEFPALLLHRGDLLFNRTNSADLVGKTAIYSGRPDPCSFASYLIRIRTTPGLLPPIVMYSLNGGFGRSWIKSVVNQTVGQANVNGTKLASFSFPLPPSDEQAAIVDAVENRTSIIDHLEVELNDKLKSAQGLRQSILRDAFTGTLVPQDPRDEPATELLKRIAAEREERVQASERAKRPSKHRTDPPTTSKRLVTLGRGNKNR